MINIVKKKSICIHNRDAKNEKILPVFVWFQLVILKELRIALSQENKMVEKHLKVKLVSTVNGIFKTDDKCIILN